MSAANGLFPHACGCGPLLKSFFWNHAPELSENLLTQISEIDDISYDSLLKMTNDELKKLGHQIIKIVQDTSIQQMTLIPAQSYEDNADFFVANRCRNKRCTHDNNCFKQSLAPRKFSLSPKWQSQIKCAYNFTTAASFRRRHVLLCATNCPKFVTNKQVL